MSFFGFRRAASPPPSPWFTPTAARLSSNVAVQYPRSTWETSATISSPPGTPLRPTLDIDIPLYGLMIVNPPEEARVHAQLNGGAPKYDHLLHGVLHIALPPGSGPVRCKAVLIAFRAVAQLDMGPGRFKEETLIFERKVLLEDETGEGILLDGVKGIDFSITLPSTLAARDWSPHGRIFNFLHAEVQGVPSSTRRGSTPRTSPSPRTSPPRRGSPSSPTPFDLSSIGDVSAIEASLPRPPEYDAALGRTVTYPWLEGSHSAERTIRVQYNPDPAGGVNTLDEQASGLVAGLGHYDIRLFADIWTVSSLLKAKVVITDIPAETTLFCFRVYLCQTHDVRSPRDGKQVHSTHRYLIVQEGQRPPETQQYPGSDCPAIHRGKAAGGSHEDVLVLESSGRVFDEDDKIRHSTLPGIETPMHISHILETQIFFSVNGLDARGRPTHRSTPGELRIMRVQRNVMLPTCTIIPALLHLPDYEHPEERQYWKHPDQSWRMCACGYTIEEMEDRMNAAEQRREDEHMQAEQATNAKVEAERGRRAM